MSLCRPALAQCRTQISSISCRSNARGVSLGPLVRMQRTSATSGKSAGLEAIVMDPEGRIVGGPKKLRSVVADALCRWYREAEQEAMQGDVKAAALLGSMLIEGYGCEANPEKGKEWLEKARRRGYRMQGVYCEI